jgi:hypothetical protein
MSCEMLCLIVLAIVIAGAVFITRPISCGGFKTASWVPRPAKVEITEADHRCSMPKSRTTSACIRRTSAVEHHLPRGYADFLRPVPQEAAGTGPSSTKGTHPHEYHVVAEARRLEADLLIARNIARPYRTDRPHDLAIIQIKATNLTP